MADQITNYLFTQGILGVVAVGLIVVVIYLQKKIDRKDLIIEALQNARLADNKEHTADYREMSKDDQQIMNDTSQNLRVMSEKIEVAKGRH